MKDVLWLGLAVALGIRGAHGAERPPDRSPEPGLVGYWKLRGDCRDYSGHGNDGVNHGVNLDTGAFDGLGAYVEIANSASLKLGAGDFSSHDDDLGPGWKHLAAVRQRGVLKLYVDGKLVAKSSSFDPASYDVSTDQPLRIGFGQTDYFAGHISGVRIYNRALSARHIRKLFSDKPR